MQTLQNIALEDIVNVRVLQEIQDKFSESTGLAAVIVNSTGKPVTQPSNFTRFCEKVRSTTEGMARCMWSDADGGKVASRCQEPSVYRCHGGLTDLAAPIIVNDQLLGAFLAGQVIMLERDYDVADEVDNRLKDLELSTVEMKGLLAEVPIVPAKKIKAAADLLYIMSNYIVKIGMSNIVQAQLMEELKAKADLEKILRETELKALQSQVNPHFLFNTLNTIARLALIEGAERTQEVVYALSDLLRNNLRNIDSLVTLEEELQYIRNYLLIQETRFGERIQAKIDIPESLLSSKIPVMTLQPLVENAIIHGLEPQKDGGQILINSNIKNGRMVISVADTGVGVTMEQVKNIFCNEKKDVGKGQTTGIGVVNVHKRLQYYFGVQFGLEITGEPGEGTCVDIVLPYEPDKYGKI